MTPQASFTRKTLRSAQREGGLDRSESDQNGRST